MNRYLAPLYQFEYLYAADLAALVTVLLLALGLGLVAGLLPARQATRVDPVDVLREG
jgi:ABC-type lipoprotein release transport system permease subunit